MARDDIIRMRSLRLRYAPLRMTFCWLEDANADEILTTSLRSAQDDIMAKDDGNKDEILTTPFHFAQDDGIRMRSSRLHFVPLRMTVRIGPSTLLGMTAELSIHPRTTLKNDE